MQNEHTKEPVKETIRIRSRKIAADFMRIEDAGTMPALNPFEIETRKEIAAKSRTARDEIADREAEHERLSAFRAGKRKIRSLIKKGALTRRQRVIYELCYVNKLRDSEVGDMLGLSAVTVRRVRSTLIEALSRSVREDRLRKAAISRAAFFKLTRRQKQIFTLYFHEARNPKDISEAMGLSERNVYYILKRIQKKLFQDRNIQNP